MIGDAFELIEGEGFGLALWCVWRNDICEVVGEVSNGELVGVRRGRDAYGYKKG